MNQHAPLLLIMGVVTYDYRVRVTGITSLRVRSLLHIFIIRITRYVVNYLLLAYSSLAALSSSKHTNINPRLIVASTHTQVQSTCRTEHFSTPDSPLPGREDTIFTGLEGVLRRPRRISRVSFCHSIVSCISCLVALRCIRSILSWPFKPVYSCSFLLCLCHLPSDELV